MRNALRHVPAASVVILALIVLSVSQAAAQIIGMHGNGVASHGVPASVTSFGFGGHPGFHGVPASVTSQGFGGGSNFRGFSGRLNSFGSGTRNEFHGHRFDSGRRARRPFATYGSYYGGYYNYAPYAYPYYLDDDSYSDSAPDQPSASEYRDDQDRRILDEDYRAGLDRPKAQSVERIPELVGAQPSTLLIFKDGHQQEISNYAIVGPTLYDLSGGRSKKVQLADLDLSATVKQNDERGVEFQIPGQSKLN